MNIDPQAAEIANLKQQIVENKRKNDRLRRENGRPIKKINRLKIIEGCDLVDKYINNKNDNNTINNYNNNNNNFTKKY